MARFGSKQSRGIRQNVRVDNLKRNILGMAQNKAETFLRPEQASDIVNMHATQEGSWSSDNVGYTLINSGDTAYESGASLDGMVQYIDSDFGEHLFIAINGKIGEVNTTTGALTLIDSSTGFTAGNSVDFEGLNDVLYSTDGTTNAPRRWDGTYASSAAGWPVSDGGGNTYAKPKYLVQHQNRLVGLNLQGGTSVWPSTFVISEYGDPESFNLGVSSASAFIGECQPGDGQQIVGAGSIFVPSSNQQQLIIFKNNSTYMMAGNSGLDTDADSFKLVRINGTYGALNNKCIVNVGNDILALDKFGVTSYTSLSASGDIQPNTVNSDSVKKIVESINPNATDKCWGVHLPKRREVIFFIPVKSSTVCNAAIVFRYPAPGTDEVPKWSRRTASGGKFNLTCGVATKSTFYIGTSDGFVGTMFTSSTYDGVGVPYKYEYPFLPLGNEEQIKRIPHGFAHFKARSSTTADLLTRWQGGGNNDSGSCPLSINTTNATDKYGTAIYGSSYYQEAVEIRVPFEPMGDGFRFKPILSGTTGSIGPEFLGVTLIHEAGGLTRHWN